MTREDFLHTVDFFLQYSNSCYAVHKHAVIYEDIETAYVKKKESMFVEYKV